MVNRKKTLEMMSSIPARMEQIRYEAKKHGGIIPQIAEPGLPGPVPIQDPKIDPDYIKKHYNLIKRITPGPLDTHFDHTIRLRTYNAIVPVSFNPVAGNEQLFWSYRVPQGSRLIIQQFLFFAEVDESPAIPYLVLAEPHEFFSMIDFTIKVNGRTPGDITYEPVTIAGASAQFDGWSILSKDIHGDSPNRGGVVFPALSNELIEISVRNRVYSYAYVYPNQQTVRRIWYVGCRIKGFTSPVNPEEK